MLNRMLNISNPWIYVSQKHKHNLCNGQCKMHECRSNIHNRRLEFSRHDTGGGENSLREIFVFFTFYAIKKLPCKCILLWTSILCFYTTMLHACTACRNRTRNTTHDESTCDQRERIPHETPRRTAFVSRPYVDFSPRYGRSSSFTDGARWLSSCAGDQRRTRSTLPYARAADLTPLADARRATL